MVIITPDAIDAIEGRSTPRARPQLTSFSNRTYTASPLGNRLTTPQRQGSPVRRNRDDLSRSRLGASPSQRPAGSNGSSRAVIPNIFAPGASPAPKKLRASINAPVTPSRSTASRGANAELFVQRIPDPPQDLTGEALSQQIPKHLESRGSVYADQYLANLCPKEFNEEQRRQFFCILDLRRLKFAATEIFAKKDWKINIMNFAKEFEKSRSMIMLRYGLYEFKNVKPSAEVLRKWRAAHGLPDPETDASGVDGTRQNGFPSATKRKAEEQLTKDTALSALSAASPSKGNKRRAFEVDDSSESDVVMNKNKRKATVSDEVEEESPSKFQKSTTRSLFESIAGSPSTTPISKPFAKAPAAAPVPKPNAFTSADKPNLFAAAAKPANGVAKSVFDIKPSNLQPPAGNIFGYLSDSSAKNSAADADSSDDEAEAPGAPASSEPSVIASGRAGTPASEAGLFGAKKPVPSLFAAAAPQDSRESTPGRSLFDRVGEKKEEKMEKPAPSNQTWTAGTPIKFGSSTENADKTQTPTPAFSFGSSDTKPASSLFQTKPTGLFGAAPSTPAPFPSSKTEVAAPPMTAPPKATAGLFGAKPAEKEDDKPASSVMQSSTLFGASSKPAQEPKPAASGMSFTTAPSAIFGAANTSNKSGLFQGSYSAPEEKKEEKPTAPEKKDPPPSAIFGAAPAASTTGLFQGTYKPSPSPSPAPELKPEQPAAPITGLFGAKPAESKPAPGLFGLSQPVQSTPSPTPGLFGATQPAPSKVEAPVTGLFGSSQAPSTPKPAAKTAAPIFSFGGTPADKPVETNLFGSTTASKPVETSNLFGGLTASKPAETSNLFGGAAASPFGSPMKTDNSPVKKPVPAQTGSLFNFGAATPATSNIFSSSTTENKPSSNIFSGVNNAGADKSAGLFSFGSPAPTEKASNMFGGTSFASTAPPGSANSSFTFQAGDAGGNTGGNAGGNVGQSFNNPFASGVNPAAPPSANSSFDFNFGGAPSTPAPTVGGGSSFVFGAGSQATPTASGGMFSFGANTGVPSAGLSTPSGRKRGASPALGSAKKPFTASSAPKPSFSFTAATPQQALPQPGAMSFTFGQQNQPQNQAPSSIFSNLQPPAGGASTSGTNSPFVFGGSSVATTPAAGTPEPHAEADGDAEAAQEQINLTSGGPGEEEETVLHEVRTKALKYIPPGSQESDDGDGKSSKSPWVTQGLGPLRLLQNKSTGTVRLLLRAEPRGHVALNRTILPGEKYAPTEKYVKITTSNETGTGLETWMLQVKTKELAAGLAAALEQHKGANK